MDVLARMIEELARLTKRVLDIVKHEQTCRQLMTTPGVGPIPCGAAGPHNPARALTFRATIDRPERFERSRDVGAHLGLTPSRYQSGETDIVGKISRKIGEGGGDELARTGLVEAAHTLLVRSSKWSALRASCGAAGPPHPAAAGLAIAKRRGMVKAKIAPRGAAGSPRPRRAARKLAVILHRMWIDGTDFRFANEAVA